MYNAEQLKQQAKGFITVVNQIEAENNAAIRSKESLEKAITDLVKNNENNKQALDIATHAIEILKQVSDEAVGKAYGFLEQSLNSALEKMFKNSTRKIKLEEKLRNKQYPQLEILLHVGNGKVRSLKNDSGHGIAQIVSLLSILSLIVITGSRRILVMDEIISGVDVANRKIISDIMWTFTQIGFQFIVNDHGFVPEGSHVYHLEMLGEMSHVKQDYIASKGVYLQSDGKSGFDYGDMTDEEELDSIIQQSGGVLLGNAEPALGENNSQATVVNETPVQISQPIQNENMTSPVQSTQPVIQNTASTVQENDMNNVISI